MGNAQSNTDGGATEVVHISVRPLPPLPEDPEGEYDLDSPPSYPPPPPPLEDGNSRRLSWKFIDANLFKNRKSGTLVVSGHGDHQFDSVSPKPLHETDLSDTLAVDDSNIVTVRYLDSDDNITLNTSPNKSWGSRNMQMVMNSELDSSPNSPMQVVNGTRPSNGFSRNLNSADIIKSQDSNNGYINPNNKMKDSFPYHSTPKPGSNSNLPKLNTIRLDYPEGTVRTVTNYNELELSKYSLEVDSIGSTGTSVMSEDDEFKSNESTVSMESIESPKKRSFNFGHCFGESKPKKARLQQQKDDTIIINNDDIEASPETVNMKTIHKSKLRGNKMNQQRNRNGKIRNKRQKKSGNSSCFGKSKNTMGSNTSLNGQPKNNKTNIELNTFKVCETDFNTDSAKMSISNNGSQCSINNVNNSNICLPSENDKHITDDMVELEVKGITKNNIHISKTKKNKKKLDIGSCFGNKNKRDIDIDASINDKGANTELAKNTDNMESAEIPVVECEVNTDVGLSLPKPHEEVLLKKADFKLSKEVSTKNKLNLGSCFGKNNSANDVADEISVHDLETDGSLNSIEVKMEETGLKSKKGLTTLGFFLGKNKKTNVDIAVDMGETAGLPKLAIEDCDIVVPSASLDEKANIPSPGSEITAPSLNIEHDILELKTPISNTPILTIGLEGNCSPSEITLPSVNIEQDNLELGTPISSTPILTSDLEKNSSPGLDVELDRMDGVIIIPTIDMEVPSEEIIPVVDIQLPNKPDLSAEINHDISLNSTDISPINLDAEIKPNTVELPNLELSHERSELSFPEVQITDISRDKPDSKTLGEVFLNTPDTDIKKIKIKKRKDKVNGLSCFGKSKTKKDSPNSSIGLEMEERPKDITIKVDVPITAIESDTKTPEAKLKKRKNKISGQSCFNRSKTKKDAPRNSAELEMEVGIPDTEIQREVSFTEIESDIKKVEEKHQRKKNRGNIGFCFGKNKNTDGKHHTSEHSIDEKSNTAYSKTDKDIEVSVSEIELKVSKKASNKKIGPLSSCFGKQKSVSLTAEGCVPEDELVESQNSIDMEGKKPKVTHKKGGEKLGSCFGSSNKSEIDIDGDPDGDTYKQRKKKMVGLTSCFRINKPSKGKLETDVGASSTHLDVKANIPPVSSDITTHSLNIEKDILEGTVPVTNHPTLNIDYDGNIRPDFNVELDRIDGSTEIKKVDLESSSEVNISGDLSPEINYDLPLTNTEPIHFDVEMKPITAELLNVEKSFESPTLSLPDIDIQIPDISMDKGSPKISSEDILTIPDIDIKEPQLKKSKWKSSGLSCFGKSKSKKDMYGTSADFDNKSSSPEIVIQTKSPIIVAESGIKGPEVKINENEGKGSMLSCFGKSKYQKNTSGPSVELKSDDQSVDMETEAKVHDIMVEDTIKTPEVKLKKSKYNVSDMSCFGKSKTKQDVYSSSVDFDIESSTPEVEIQTEVPIIPGEGDMKSPDIKLEKTKSKFGGMACFGKSKTKKNSSTPSAQVEIVSHPGDIEIQQEVSNIETKEVIKAHDIKHKKSKNKVSVMSCFGKSTTEKDSPSNSAELEIEGSVPDIEIKAVVPITEAGKNIKDVDVEHQRKKSTANLGSCFGKTKKIDVKNETSLRPLEKEDSIDIDSPFSKTDEDVEVSVKEVELNVSKNKWYKKKGFQSSCFGKKKSVNLSTEVSVVELEIVGSQKDIEVETEQPKVKTKKAGAKLGSCFGSSNKSEIDRNVDEDIELHTQNKQSKFGLTSCFSSDKPSKRKFEIDMEVPSTSLDVKTEIPAASCTVTKHSLNVEQDSLEMIIPVINSPKLSNDLEENNLPDFDVELAGINGSSHQTKVGLETSSEVNLAGADIQPSSKFDLSPEINCDLFQKDTGSINLDAEMKTISAELLNIDRSLESPAISFPEIESQISDISLDKTNKKISGEDIVTISDIVIKEPLLKKNKEKSSVLSCFGKPKTKGDMYMASADFETEDSPPQLEIQTEVPIIVTESDIKEPELKIKKNEGKLIGLSCFGKSKSTKKLSGSSTELENEGHSGSPNMTTQEEDPVILVGGNVKPSELKLQKRKDRFNGMSCFGKSKDKKEVYRTAADLNMEDNPSQIEIQAEVPTIQIESDIKAPEVKLKKNKGKVSSMSCFGKSKRKKDLSSHSGKYDIENSPIDAENEKEVSIITTETDIQESEVKLKKPSGKNSGLSCFGKSKTKKDSPSQSARIDIEGHPSDIDIQAEVPNIVAKNDINEADVKQNKNKGKLSSMSCFGKSKGKKDVSSPSGKLDIESSPIDKENQTNVTIIATESDIQKSEVKLKNPNGKNSGLSCFGRSKTKKNSSSQSAQIDIEGHPSDIEILAEVPNISAESDIKSSDVKLQKRDDKFSGMSCFGKSKRKKEVYEPSTNLTIEDKSPATLNVEDSPTQMESQSEVPIIEGDIKVSDVKLKKNKGKFNRMPCFGKAKERKDASGNSTELEVEHSPINFEIQSEVPIISAENDIKEPEINLKKKKPRANLGSCFGKTTKSGDKYQSSVRDIEEEESIDVDSSFSKIDADVEVSVPEADLKVSKRALNKEKVSIGSCFRKRKSVSLTTEESESDIEITGSEKGTEIETKKLKTKKGRVTLGTCFGSKNKSEMDMDIDLDRNTPRKKNKFGLTSCFSNDKQTIGKFDSEVRASLTSLELKTNIPSVRNDGTYSLNGEQDILEATIPVITTPKLNMDLEGNISPKLEVELAEINSSINIPKIDIESSSKLNIPEDDIELSSKLDLSPETNHDLLLRGAESINLKAEMKPIPEELSNIDTSVESSALYYPDIDVQKVNSSLDRPHEKLSGEDIVVGPNIDIIEPQIKKSKAKNSMLSCFGISNSKKDVYLHSTEFDIEGNSPDIKIQTEDPIIGAEKDNKTPEVKLKNRKKNVSGLSCFGKSKDKKDSSGSDLSIQLETESHPADIEIQAEVPNIATKSDFKSHELKRDTNKGKGSVLSCFGKSMTKKDVSSPSADFDIDVSQPDIEIQTEDPIVVDKRDAQASEKNLKKTRSKGLSCIGKSKDKKDSSSPSPQIDIEGHPADIEIQADHKVVAESDIKGSDAKQNKGKVSSMSCFGKSKQKKDVSSHSEKLDIEDNRIDIEIPTEVPIIADKNEIKTPDLKIRKTRVKNSRLSCFGKSKTEKNSPRPSIQLDSEREIADLEIQAEVPNIAIERDIKSSQVKLHKRKDRFNGMSCFGKSKSNYEIHEPSADINIKGMPSAEFNIEDSPSQIEIQAEVPTITVEGDFKASDVKLHKNKGKVSMMSCFGKSKEKKDISNHSAKLEIEDNPIDIEIQTEVPIVADNNEIQAPDIKIKKNRGKNSGLSCFGKSKTEKNSSTPSIQIDIEDEIDDIEIQAEVPNIATEGDIKQPEVKLHKHKDRFSGMSCFGKAKSNYDEPSGDLNVKGTPSQIEIQAEVPIIAAESDIKASDVKLPKNKGNVSMMSCFGKSKDKKDVASHAAKLEIEDSPIDIKSQTEVPITSVESDIKAPEVKLTKSRGKVSGLSCFGKSKTKKDSPSPSAQIDIEGNQSNIEMITEVPNIETESVIKTSDVKLKKNKGKLSRMSCFGQSKEKKDVTNHSVELQIEDRPLEFEIESEDPIISVESDNKEPEVKYKRKNPRGNFGSCFGKSKNSDVNYSTSLPTVVEERSTLPVIDQEASIDGELTFYKPDVEVSGPEVDLIVSKKSSTKNKGLLGSCFGKKKSINLTPEGSLPEVELVVSPKELEINSEDQKMKTKEGGMLMMNVDVDADIDIDSESNKKFGITSCFSNDKDSRKNFDVDLEAPSTYIEVNSNILPDNTEITTPSLKMEQNILKSTIPDINTQKVNINLEENISSDLAVIDGSTNEMNVDIENSLAVNIPADAVVISTPEINYDLSQPDIGPLNFDIGIEPIIEELSTLGKSLSIPEIDSQRLTISNDTLDTKISSDDIVSTTDIDIKEPQLRKGKQKIPGLSCFGKSKSKKNVCTPSADFNIAGSAPVIDLQAEGDLKGSDIKSPEVKQNVSIAKLSGLFDFGKSKPQKVAPNTSAELEIGTNALDIEAEVPVITDESNKNVHAVKFNKKKTRNNLRSCFGKTTKSDVKSISVCGIEEETSINIDSPSSKTIPDAEVSVPETAVNITKKASGNKGSLGSCFGKKNSFNVTKEVTIPEVEYIGSQKSIEIKTKKPPVKNKKGGTTLKSYFSSNKKSDINPDVDGDLIMHTQDKRKQFGLTSCFGKDKHLEGKFETDIGNPSTSLDKMPNIQLATSEVTVPTLNVKQDIFEENILTKNTPKVTIALEGSTCSLPKLDVEAEVDCSMIVPNVDIKCPTQSEISIDDVQISSELDLSPEATFDISPNSMEHSNFNDESKPINKEVPGLETSIERPFLSFPEIDITIPDNSLDNREYNVPEEVIVGTSATKVNNNKTRIPKGKLGALSCFGKSKEKKNGSKLSTQLEIEGSTPDVQIHVSKLNTKNDISCPSAQFETEETSPDNAITGDVPNNVDEGNITDYEVNNGKKKFRAKDSLGFCFGRKKTVSVEESLSDVETQISKKDINVNAGMQKSDILKDEEILNLRSDIGTNQQNKKKKLGLGSCFGYVTPKNTKVDKNIEVLPTPLESNVNICSVSSDAKTSNLNVKQDILELTMPDIRTSSISNLNIEMDGSSLSDLDLELGEIDSSLRIPKTDFEVTSDGCIPKSGIQHSNKIDDKGVIKYDLPLEIEESENINAELNPLNIDLPKVDDFIENVIIAVPQFDNPDYLVEKSEISSGVISAAPNISSEKSNLKNTKEKHRGMSCFGKSNANEGPYQPSPKVEAEYEVSCVEIENSVIKETKDIKEPVEKINNNKSRPILSLCFGNPTKTETQEPYYKIDIDTKSGISESTNVKIEHSQNLDTNISLSHKNTGDDLSICIDDYEKNNIQQVSSDLVDDNNTLHLQGPDQVQGVNISQFISTENTNLINTFLSQSGTELQGDLLLHSNSNLPEVIETNTPRMIPSQLDIGDRAVLDTKYSTDFNNQETNIENCIGCDSSESINDTERRKYFSVPSISDSISEDIAETINTFKFLKDALIEEKQISQEPTDASGPELPTRWYKMDVNSQQPSFESTINTNGEPLSLESKTYTNGQPLSSEDTVDTELTIPSDHFIIDENHLLINSSHNQNDIITEPNLDTPSTSPFVSSLSEDILNEFIKDNHSEMRKVVQQMNLNEPSESTGNYFTLDITTNENTPSENIINKQSGESGVVGVESGNISDYS